MTKFEYSDFYKFIASAGIALITLAALVPWLFLREPFDLFKSVDEISKLTPLAQRVVATRQETIQNIFNFIPLFSIASFALGLVGLVMGGVMWYRKTQLFLDKLAELNIKNLEKQLDVSSEQEIKVQHEQEIKAQLADSQETLEHEATPELDEVLKPDNVNSIVQSAIRIEKKVTGLLVSCFSDTHTILPERRLGPITFDIIMASKTSKPDYIFEVKYIRRGFKYAWLRDNTQKIVYANRSYQQETNRPAIPVLFIVGQEKMTPSPAEVEKYINRVQSEISSLDYQVLVVFFTENEFSNMDCTKLKSKLQA